MKLDQNAKYAKTHEWVRREGAEVVCGISDHAQAALGDIVYVDLPTVGKHYKKGQAFGVIESVKAASDLYMPMSGTVLAVNTDLADHPDLVNKDCYGKGWLLKFTAEIPSEWDHLLDSADYTKVAEKE
jgi:glycine cleavage system H protein